MTANKVLYRRLQDDSASEGLDGDEVEPKNDDDSGVMYIVIAIIVLVIIGFFIVMFGLVPTSGNFLLRYRRK